MPRNGPLVPAESTVVLTDALPGKLTRLGWEPPDGLTFEEWLSVGLFLRGLGSSLMWAWGDWYATGEHRWGEMYAQGVEATDYKNQTLRRAKYVATRFDMLRRRNNCYWSFHLEVAALNEVEQDKWLDKATAQDWSRNKLREEIAMAAALSPVPLPDGKYGAIYADPPWSFQAWSGKGTARSAENHFPTMEQHEIEALRIGKLAAPDCVLFLWAVMPQLPEALAVIEAWGFEYKTCAFVWVKRTKDRKRWATGMGYWTRANAELCLLATRGSPTRLSASVTQIIEGPRGRHSEKPKITMDRIERLVGGPYLELFARATRKGWESWGNQIET